MRTPAHPMPASYWIKPHLGLQGHCTQRLEPTLHCIALDFCCIALWHYGSSPLLLIIATNLVALRVCGVVGHCVVNA